MHCRKRGTCRHIPHNSSYLFFVLAEYLHLVLGHERKYPELYSDPDFAADEARSGTLHPAAAEVDTIAAALMQPEEICRVLIDAAGETAELGLKKNADRERVMALTAFLFLQARFISGLSSRG